MRLRFDGLQWNLILGTSRRSVEKVQFWLNSDKNIWAFYTRRAKDVLLLRRHGFAIKALLYDSQYLYIVDTDTQHFVCIAAMVTRIHQSVTLIRTLPNTSRSIATYALSYPYQVLPSRYSAPVHTLTVLQIIEKYPALKGTKRSSSFDFFLTVHHSTDFSKYQLSAQFF
jgi:hypothetical protein